MQKNLSIFTLLVAVCVLANDLIAQHDLTLNLVFDRYRSETSWKLINSGSVIAEGGNYGDDYTSNGEYPLAPIAIENLPDGDYIFRMIDEYGDGMCCQYGNGGYELVNDTDGAIIVSGGVYGDSVSTSFSLPFVAPQSGCTDPEAVNYNPDAEQDDGSCAYLTSELSINLEPFATGLTSPVSVKHAGDERLFVCEQSTGRVRILDENGSIIGTFINVGSDISTGGERGLLGIAFHPNYSENGYFYLNYTDNSGDTEIIRYTVSEDDPNDADENSGQVVLRINQDFGNHNAGDLAFGPDGYLYIPMGDGGSAGDPNNNAQTMTELLGKMLRIDVDGDDFPGDAVRNYAIPSDNPFVNESTVLDEIWATGLRNPWRFSFDRETNDIWIADVGQNAYEEVNFQPASSTGGENYGWRCYEGLNEYNTAGCQGEENYEFPVFEYSQNEYGWCSVSGGYVYRGEQYPLLQGHYLLTDYCGGTFYSLRQNAQGNWVTQLVDDDYAGFGFVGFGEDVDGELYAVRVNNGTIYRIEEPCSASIPEITEDGPQLTASEGESYQWLLDGNLIEGATDQSYVVEESGTYSVVVDAGNGCVVESEEVTVVISGLEEEQGIHDLTLSPNPSKGNFVLRANIEQAGNLNVLVLDKTGRQVQTLSMGSVSGQVNRSLDLSGLSQGMYFLNIHIGDANTTQRVVIVH